MAPPLTLGRVPVADLSPSIVAISWFGGRRLQAGAFVAAATDIAAHDPDSAAALA